MPQTAPAPARAPSAQIPSGFLNKEERRALAVLKQAIDDKNDRGYRAPQFQLLDLAVQIIASADRGAWQGVADIIALAIDKASNVPAVTPYIFHSADAASRIHPSSFRTDLKAILDRLNKLPWARTRDEEDLRAIARSAVAAAIAADKGAIHVTRQNLGHILQRIHASASLSAPINWHQTLKNALGRTAGNLYKAP